MSCKSMKLNKRIMLSQHPNRPLPSRRITRRLSFSSPQNSKKLARFANCDDVSDVKKMKSPTATPIKQINSPRTPMKEINSPNLQRNERRQETPKSTQAPRTPRHDIENTPPVRKRVSRLPNTLPKLRRNLYLEQLVNEREEVKKEQKVMNEFQSLRL